MRRLARGMTAAALVIAAAITAAPVAWAWYGPAAYVTPSSGTPGATVTALGTSFDKDDPVMARLDGLDGPIVATFTPKSGKLSGPLMVPTDAKPGTHVVVFTQYDASGAIEQMPPRATLSVTSDTAGNPLVATPLAANTGTRVAGLTRTTGSQPIGLGTLFLVAIGAAALCVFFAAIIVLGARRRGRTVAGVSTRS